jgi:flagellar protein FlaI
MIQPRMLRKQKDILHYTVVSLPADLPKGAKVEAEYRFEYSVPHSRALTSPVSLDVTVASLGGKGYYVVKEPPLDLELKGRIEEAVRTSYSSVPGNEVLAEDPLGYLMLGVKEAGPLEGATDAEILTVAYYLGRDMMGYGLIDPYLRDPYIEDLSCDGVGRNIRIWHSLHNEFDWLEGSLRFEGHDSLDSTALRLANRSGAFVSAATPLVDATLPEGYRLSCTWRDEVSSFGSSFTVRKFRAKPFSITELIHMGTIASDVAAFLWSLLELKGFIWVVGSSASGKTTLLNSLASLMNPNWKVVTIEDVREINLQNPGWKALHTRTGALSGYGRVGLFELVRLSLRERPDYVILGEARGEETSVLFQSASTGHGCITTFHATDEDALWARLTQPPISIPLSLLGLMDAVVFVARTPGQSARSVLRVSEYQDGWRTIFRRQNGRYEGGADVAIKFWRRGEASNLTPARQAKDVDDKRRLLEEWVRGEVFSYEGLADRLREYYAGNTATA